VGIVHHRNALTVKTEEKQKENNHEQVRKEVPEVAQQGRKNTGNKEG
jgi:hypothetical protein